MSSEKQEVMDADRNPVHGEKLRNSGVVQLSAFLSTAATSPLWTINRTARYAEDPSGYLKEMLGERVFEERKDLFCLSQSIDRDMYGKGDHKQHFEQHIAKLLGKQHGLFFVTGVLAQLAALKVFAEQSGNNRVAWHVSSHLKSAECQAYKHLYGLEQILLGHDPDSLPTVEEIEEVLSLPIGERPGSILLEIPNRTLGCKTYTFSELERIAKACRQADVKLHCDGARLWEIEPYYRSTAKKSFADIGALFDSVYVSFYKGLGSTAGAVLVCDSEAVVHETKIWQRRAGGNVFTLFYQVIDSERGFNENIGSFEYRWKKMSEIVESISAATAKHKTVDGRPIVSFLPERPTCCQLVTVFQGYTVEQLERARDAVRDKIGIEVFVRLRQSRTLDDTYKEKSSSAWAREAPETRKDIDRYQNFTEWMINGETENYETQVFVDGYVELCVQLLEQAHNS